jgi:hypothetical protein
MTAGCGFCPPSAAIFIGFIGGVASNIVARIRETLWEKVDDALDVFACHGVCGTWGVFATGLWADNEFNKANGLFSGSPGLVAKQLTGIIVVALYSFGVTYGISTVMKGFGMLRATEKEENEGLDMADHMEKAYSIVEQVVDGPALDVLHQDGAAHQLHGSRHGNAGIVRILQHPVLVVCPVAGKDFQDKALTVSSHQVNAVLPAEEPGHQRQAFEREFQGFAGHHDSPWQMTRFRLTARPGVLPVSKSIN